MEGESHVTAIARVIQRVCFLREILDATRSLRIGGTTTQPMHSENRPSPNPQEQFALEVDLNLECDISADAE